MFLRFDFDGDNVISPEEVFILLSYIPFKNAVSAESSERAQQNKGENVRGKSAEGMYNRQAGRAMTQEERSLEQREIKSFVQQAFQEVPSFTLE